jgi:hypothetical protein
MAIIAVSTVAGKAEMPLSSTLLTSTALVGIKGALTKRRPADAHPVRSTTNLKEERTHQTIIHLQRYIP